MKFRKNVRLKDYDYKTNGYYFVTICTILRKPLLSKYKSEVEKILKDIQNKYNGIRIDFYSILLDHIHIIFILENSELTLGEIVRRFKALVTRKTQCKKFWEWNYFEHIIKDERSLDMIRNYIINNPYQERIDFKVIYK